MTSICEPNTIRSIHSDTTHCNVINKTVSIPRPTICIRTTRVHRRSYDEMTWTTLRISSGTSSTFPSGTESSPRAEGAFLVRNRLQCVANATTLRLMLSFYLSTHNPPRPRRSQRPRGDKHLSDHIVQCVPGVDPRN